MEIYPLCTAHTIVILLSPVFKPDFSQATENTVYQAIDIVIPGRYPY